YYLFQGDVAAGTSHLRTSVETGIALMQELRGHISGLAIPHLVIDTPGGMGKVSIGPDYVVSRGPDKWTLRNYEGKLVDYPQPADKDATCAYDEGWVSSSEFGTLGGSRAPGARSGRQSRPPLDLTFQPGRRAERGQRATGAVGLAGEADAAAVPDDLVRKADPALPRHHLHEVLLDLLG